MQSSTRSPPAGSSALKLRVDGTLRDRAANGRYAWAFDRGQDFAAGIWVIDPVFIIYTVREQLTESLAITPRNWRSELIPVAAWATASAISS